MNRSSASANLNNWLSPEGLSRLRSGNPWLFRAHLGPNFPKLADAALLPVGEHWFWYSPNSQITLRRLGPATRYWPGENPAREPIVDVKSFSEGFSSCLREHLSNLWHRKKRLVDDDLCFRWVFSESDLLPGLIVDVFANVWVIQIQSLPIFKFWGAFAKIFDELATSLGIPPPQLKILPGTKLFSSEGLPAENFALDSRAPIPGDWYRWNEFEWWMRPGEGQKTGAFFDQRENHRAARSWARKLGLKDALDVCSFEGGFGMHLLAEGMQVKAVDSSELALETARKNVQRNFPEAKSRFETEKADVFEFLKNLHSQKGLVDMIVLDPPGFVKSKDALASAMRGYKELNLRALHSVKPGGLLVSCSCSHAVSATLFEEMLRSASHDARRHIKVLEIKGPSADHAPCPSLSESSYLQAWFIEVT